jgi:glycosyltransferase involved in cell wall biosynthesis
LIALQVIHVNICFLSPYPPQTGGVPVHTSGLAKKLAARHRIAVITYGRMGRQSEKGLDIFQVPVLNIRFLRGLSYFIGAVIQLFRLGRRRRIDVIHCEYMHPLGPAALLYRKLAKRKPKVVVTAHGSDLISLGGSMLGRRLVKWIGNSSDRVICVSRYLASKAAKAGIRPGHVSVIYNGVDDSEFPQGSRERLRKRLRLPLKRKIVTFAGSLNEAKGADVFVILARHMLERAQMGDVKTQMMFILIGGGADRKELERYCRKNGISGSVIFAGPLGHRKALQHIKSSDVLVIPSRVEGFGLTALEGMAMGVPVAAGRAGALPEILSPCSLTGNMPKTVRDILRGGKLRSKVVRENRKLAGRFSLERMVNETDKLYRDVKRSA